VLPLGTLVLGYNINEWRLPGAFLYEAIARVYGGMSAYQRGDYSAANDDCLIALRLLSDAEGAYPDLGNAYDTADIYNRPMPTFVRSMAARLEELGVKLPFTHREVMKLAVSEIDRLRTVLKQEKFTSPEGALELQRALQRLHFVGMAITFLLDYSSY
jgi:hypothetical protein